MKKLLCVLMLFSMISCREQVSAPMQKFVIKGLIQGTTYSITYNDTHESVLKSDLDSILHEFDKSCSIYLSTSLICRINDNSVDTLDQNISECLEVSAKLYDVSDGLYDITILPLTEAYGFAAKEKSSKVNVDSILQIVGFDKISINGNKLIKKDPRMRIDLNSIAQGYSVDVVSRYFDSKGIENYLVEIGGEVYGRGVNITNKEWRVGIDKPIDGNFDSSQGMQAIISLSGLGLATSGNYRKFYNTENGERVNHTLNPKTGISSKNNLLSATILASNATIADGYATVCMVSGLEKSKDILLADTTLYGMLIYSEGDSIKTFITSNLESKIIEQ